MEVRDPPLADILAEVDLPMLGVAPAYHDAPMFLEIGRTGSWAVLRAVKVHCMDSSGDPTSGVVVSNILPRPPARPEFHVEPSDDDVVEDHLVNFISRFIPDEVFDRRVKNRPVIARSDHRSSGEATPEVAGERFDFVLRRHREWPLEFARLVAPLRGSSVCVAAWNADLRAYLEHLCPIDAAVADAIDQWRDD